MATDVNMALENLVDLASCFDYEQLRHAGRVPLAKQIPLHPPIRRDKHSRHLQRPAPPTPIDLVQHRHNLFRSLRLRRRKTGHR